MGQALERRLLAVALLTMTGVLHAGCGEGGGGVDPRELEYCGGTCYGDFCCAPADPECPELMPLEGTDCTSIGLACGYGCDVPTTGYYHVAECGESGWITEEVHCDPPT
ncbi:MAG: hypothetical protein ACODAU_09655 [Myxococcota bacterium]